VWDGVLREGERGVCVDGVLCYDEEERGVGVWMACGERRGGRWWRVCFVGIGLVGGWMVGWLVRRIWLGGGGERDGWWIACMDFGAGNIAFTRGEKTSKPIYI